MIRVEMTGRLIGFKEEDKDKMDYKTGSMIKKKERFMTLFSDDLQEAQKVYIYGDEPFTFKVEDVLTVSLCTFDGFAGKAACMAKDIRKIRTQKSQS